MPGTVVNTPKDDEFVYQPYIVSLSVLCFLVYFTILREESDIDIQLSGNLYDKVEGLEKQDLLTSIKYYEDNGLDARDLRKRLEEVLQLEEEEEKKKMEDVNLED